eukprot:scaffold106577_cov30-Tisochrysis_lutea.AAC.4
MTPRGAGRVCVELLYYTVYAGGVTLVAQSADPSRHSKYGRRAAALPSLLGLWHPRPPSPSPLPLPKRGRETR